MHVQLPGRFQTGYTVKIVYESHGFSLTKPSREWDGGKLIPARESFVSDIPAGDRNIANIFYSVVLVLHYRENYISNIAKTAGG